MTPTPVDPAPREPRRRTRSVAWAAAGCTTLAILGLALLGSCGYVLSRLVARLGG